VNRATLDTNIYVSAFEFGGTPMRLLQMGVDSEIEIAVSQPIIDETTRILREKFGWSEADLRDALLVMESCATKVTPTERLHVVSDDPDDDRILECAAAAGSDYLVTGDKHLLRLKNFLNIRIVNPRDFLAEGKSREI